MGNWFAYTILLTWPLITVYLYRTKTIQAASLWAIVGGYMFLPVKTAIDLPYIPAMNKSTIPVISTLIACWLIKKKRISFIKAQSKISFFFILLMIVPLISAGLNKDGIIIGDLSLPSMSYYDGFTWSVSQFFLIAPFFVGKEIFKTFEDQLLMFKFLVAAGLLYSMPMLFEVRMSPQLHTWIYGYFPHSFAQVRRFDGFRPVVFMGHGLAVAFFMVAVLTSAAVLWKTRIKLNLFSPAIIAHYVLIVLMFCKSFAAFLYGVFAFVLILFSKPKTQIKIAVLLASMAMFYPIMSITNIFPHQTIIDVATSINEERGRSLQDRFDNEEKLLIHAKERFYFGWGGWGRNRVFNQETGKDESVTDGRWILTLGQFGIIGFIAEFGLLAMTVFRAYSALRFLESRRERTLLSAHALLVSIIMIDQLPNASLGPWLWLLAGILLGRSEAIIAQDKMQRKLLPL